MTDWTNKTEEECGDVVYFGSMPPVVRMELGVIIAEDFLFVVEDLDEETDAS